MTLRKRTRYAATSEGRPAQRPSAGPAAWSDDKVWRDDVLAVAWQTDRRNGGARPRWTARRSRTSSRSGWTGGWGYWRGT